MKYKATCDGYLYEFRTKRDVKKELTMAQKEVDEAKEAYYNLKRSRAPYLRQLKKILTK